MPTGAPMPEPAPAREWWSAAEIAAAGLPDLPATRRGVTFVAERQGWARDPERVRRRPGRGGGTEYHWSLLPPAARAALVAVRPRGIAAPAGRDEAWARWESLPEAVREAARMRLSVLAGVEAAEAAGQSRAAAIRLAAAAAGLSTRTIWGWFALVADLRADDRLPALAPRHRDAERPAAAVDCTPAAWEALKADYLRPSQPAFTACYRRIARIAAREGWTIPSEATLRRRMAAEVSPVTQALARQGVEAARRKVVPPQERDRTALHALEAVNADFHRFDVFVRWGGGEGEAARIVRPQLVAFQDIHSGRILSWRLDETPNKTAVQLAFGDLVEEFGIPDHVLVDNGREFANKLLTGGAPTRYRFKVRDDDIPGLFTAMGVQIHWATPYSGQSKPIERAFRDLCEDIARDPRCEGAWTGNRPDAKPENYASHAVPRAEFEALVAEGIHAHNARTGRRGQTARGRSFLEVFEASYAEAAIRRATPEQRRLWLLGAEGVRAARDHGAIEFMGNRYWSEFLTAVAGEKVVIRFDNGALQAGLHVYRMDGRHLGHAPCIEAKGFFDVDEGRIHARLRAQRMRAEKAALEAARTMTLIELKALMRGTAEPPPPAPVRGTVVRGAFGRGGAARAAAAAALPEAGDIEDITDRLTRGIRLVVPGPDA